MPRHRPPPPPAATTCAEFLNRVHLRSCADFVNRVGNRFDGGSTYRKFLDCLHSCWIGKFTAAAASDKIAALLKHHPDLYREFSRFLPKLPEKEAEKEKEEEERKIEETAPKRSRRRGAGLPPLPPKKLGLDESKAAEEGKIEDHREFSQFLPKLTEKGKGKRKIEEPAAMRSRRGGASPSPEKLGLDESKAAEEWKVEDHPEISRFLPKLTEKGKRKIEEETAEQPAPEKLGLDESKAAEAEERKVDDRREFSRFLPKSTEKEKGKRKIEEEEEETAEQPAAKRSRRVAEKSKAAEKRGIYLRASPDKSGIDILRLAAMENEMEESMCFVDVRLRRLKSVRRSALELFLRVAAGNISPEEIRSHFTEVQLATVGDLGRKFLEVGDAAAWSEMMVAMKRKKKALKRERSEIEEKWNWIRRKYYNLSIVIKIN